MKENFEIIKSITRNIYFISNIETGERISEIWDDINTLSVNNNMKVKINNKWHFISLDTFKKVSDEYDSITDFNNHFCVFIDSIAYLINKNTFEKVSTGYDSIHEYKDHYLAEINNEQFLLSKATCNKVTGCYYMISDLKNHYSVAIEKGDDYIEFLISKDTLKKVSIEYESIVDTGMHYLVTNTTNDKCCLLDRKTLTPVSDEYIKINQDGNGSYIFVNEGSATKVDKKTLALI